MQHPELPALCHTAGRNWQHGVQKRLLTVASLNVKGLRHKHVPALTSENSRKSRKPQERIPLTLTLIQVAMGQEEDRDCRPRSSATAVLQQMSSRLANAAQEPSALPACSKPPAGKQAGCLGSG